MNATKRTDYDSLLGSMARLAKGMPEFTSDNGNVHYYEYYINGHFVQVIYEENRFHGDILRQWAIDGNDRSPVMSKFEVLNRDGKGLLFDCSNGLCGERRFENDSIVYEFFIKPLGLDPKPFEYQECTDKIGYHIQHYSLCRVLYGENYSQNSTWIPWDHPVCKKIKETLHEENS